MTSVRPAAVAGLFYPGEQEALSAAVRRLVTDAGGDGPVPKAIIAPHAGYIYSGAVAATAYARLRPAHGRIRRVVLMGPCHHVAVRGLALSTADAFETPLGRVAVDKEAAAEALSLPQVTEMDATHGREHSLEVHLPFLQEVLDGFSVVPFVVGDATDDEVAQVLDLLWGGPETLIVVSSDLSHYLDYEAARSLDGATCRAIETLNPRDIGRDQACGRVPVRGLLTIAKGRGLAVSTVDMRNSGDTAGEKDRVVGYGSWVFVEPASVAMANAPEIADNIKAEAFEGRNRALMDRHGETLLHLAAASVQYGLERGEALPVHAGDYAPELRGHGAAFVTLTRGGKLRGCVGSYQARRSLAKDVSEHAFNAAFRDSRFSPLAMGELEGLDISVSVLGPQVSLPASDESDLIGRLRPGIDGLVLRDGDKRALFLPSVWEHLPRAGDFVTHLKRKAGMADDHWSETMCAWRFITQSVFSADLADASLLWRGQGAA